MKVLFDNSVITSDNFKLLETNNIENLISDNICEFYLPSSIFYENFIPLSHKKPQKYLNLLNKCIKFSSKIFLPLHEIIDKEINAPTQNIGYEFYDINVITNFKNDLKNGNIHWNINRNNLQQKNNQILFDAINEIIRKNNEIISKIETKQDLLNYSNYLISNYGSIYINHCNLNKTLEKGKTPKENAKKMYAYVTSSLLMDRWLNIYNTDYGHLCKLLQTNSYFWVYYQVYSYTLNARVFDGNGHKDNKYIDNEYITYMKNMDILLSNDEKYMKDCFNEIYKNNTKKIMNINDFINYAKSAI